MPADLIAAWVTDYNTVRPHSALGFHTPDGYPRDPLILLTFHAVTTACIGIGDYQKALDTAREGLKYNSSILALQLQKVSALARMQRIEEARAEAQNLLNRYPEFRISRFLRYRGKFQSSAGMAEDFRLSGLPA